MGRNSKLTSLRRFLTTPRPARYLVFILIGVWLWFSTVLEVSIFSYVGYTLLALAYLWLRPFSGLRDLVQHYRTGSKNRNPSKQKREFLLLLAFVAIMGIVFALRIDRWRGILLIAVAALAMAVYVTLTPGNVIPEGWLSKRRNKRRKRGRP